MTAQVETMVPVPVDRTSVHLTAQSARALEESGVVDYFQAWDQLIGFWPPSLWRPEHTVFANVVNDCDSFADAFVLAAFAAATTRLGVAVSTDAIRRGPAELMQTMLTLAAATEGRAVLMLGAGELKQAKPFGYRRAEGLDRLEDLLRIFPLLWECDEPIDFDGNIWKLRKAWVGTARPHRPKIWGMGAGPRFIKVVTRYADGISTGVPCSFSSPEQWADAVTHIKQELERHGRDPDKFAFSVWVLVLLHEDPEVIEKAYDNALVRFLAAVAGRINQADWEREGVDPVFPRDWHYALKLLPHQMSRKEVDVIIPKVSREMLVKSYFAGTPREVASTVEAYVEAGATHVSMVDMLPPALSLEDAHLALGRAIEFCRFLKSNGK